MGGSSQEKNACKKNELTHPRHLFQILDKLNREYLWHKGEDPKNNLSREKII